MSRWHLIFCVCASSLAAFRVFAQNVHPTDDGSNGFNENAGGGYSLPAYAVASTTSALSNSTRCSKELRDFRDAVDRRVLWSLKMLDSSGEPKAGFLYGNNYWLGSRTQCHDTMNTVPLDIVEQDLLNNTRYRDPRMEFPPFDVHYFVAHFRHNSTLQYHVNLPTEDIITLGLCLPASCTTSELSVILKMVFHDRALSIADVYSADFALIDVKDLKDDYQWLLSGRSFFICIVLVLTFSMMIIGTVYDIFVHQKHLSVRKNNAGRREETDLIASNERSTVRKVLVCFSIYTNTRIIFGTNLSENSIPVIHGLRFLSMAWIIMAHTLLYMTAYIDNKIWIWRMSEIFVAQIISNASLSVDTYFFQSGFLMTYLYLSDRQTKKRQARPINCRAKLNEFFVLIIRRFMRLTPAYIMTLGILLLASNWYDKTSQFYMDERWQDVCAKYWWRNLLYINNLFDYGTMCMSWSWYLANDMQFFVIGMALLILSTVHFYTTVFILTAILISSTVLTGYISYVHQYVPMISELYKVLTVLYEPPWTRIGPYIIGMIAAYILIRLNNTLTLRKTIVMLGWCFGGTCNVLVLFGLYNRHISVLSTAVYVALSRTVWAIGIAWIVIACSTKHGGIVNRLLSFRGWIPFSRLTYCAYLLNPFLIQSIRLYSETSIHVEFLPTITVSIGYFAISYFCAYVLSLMAETPYVLLLRMLTQSRSGKRHKPREIVISSTKI